MRIPAIGLVVILASGCFVIDELDTGMELLEQHSPAARAEEGSSGPEAAPAERSSSEPGLLQRLQRWWATQSWSAASKPDPGDVLVRCQIGSSSLFTRKSDCLARRGKAVVVALDDK